jgi:hypothetical protein
LPFTLTVKYAKKFIFLLFFLFIFFLLQRTHKLSLLSAGSAIELVDAICRGKVQNGMAVVRSVIK